MNITPGTLCLVIAGRNAGSTCTVLRRASGDEALNSLVGQCGRNLYIRDDSPIWEVDRSMEWGGAITGKVHGKIPYIKQKRLLPIPPLADPLDIKQEEEKPCTV